ncbi:uncharacterized protein LOC131649744 [Vicia villosa]|uniref:uncharacterized protein LOC131649744 n=1 Tax=Vicia villosa TaxID=3911 RepID=UPI00273CD494|nr:uncharacterized protein LOC131649744 [Vicia villosa]
MIIGSLNIRGGCSVLKRGRISNIIKKGLADIFLIQETKVVDMKDDIAKSFWKNEDVAYSFSNSSGMSGGIITLWKNDTVSVLNSFSGAGFLGIKVLWKNELYYVINVYSSCDVHKKKLLWEALVNLKGKFTDGEWIVGGDFNSIKHSRERKGRSSSGNVSEWNAFADFIDDCNLVDVPCKGKRFSWYSGDGQSMSRLDRFLVDNSIVNKWGIDKEDWGPKPFKVNNEWFTFKSFIPFVDKSWKEAVVEGRSDFVLKEKLRLLKDRLRWWNREVFGRIDLEVEEEVVNINNKYSILEEDDAGDMMDIVKGRKEASSRFWLNLRIKENMLLQKSRLAWLNEGDSNNGYFHKAMKERRRHNHIGPINSSRGMLDSVHEVKEEVFVHFANKFRETDRNRPLLEGMHFKSISLEKRAFLEIPFEEIEIKEAIWGCGGSKSPGPDGFSFLFIKKCWHIIKDEFINFFKGFHSGSDMSKAVTSSFLSLIP